MHEIQKHILKRLSLSPKLRYSDLKPRAVDGNLFVYHVKVLTKEGLIACSNERYILTVKGRRHVDRVSFETFKERAQPKIVTILVVEKDGKFLLYKRKRSPFIGFIGFPYGKIHLEERVAEAALRELAEKAGLEATLRHRGDVYITVHDETELVTHMLCHIFSGKNPAGILKTDSDIGECFWGSMEDTPQNRLIPGVKQIARLLKSKKDKFFEEYYLNVNEEQS